MLLKNSSLGCILKHRDKFPVDSLKRKKVIFFSNNTWPQYKLEDGKAWPENGNFNYNIILQFNLFCK